jgi:transcriptional regulator with XRE-family HTH domain
MATRQPRIPDADREITWRLNEVGRELRIGRVTNGLRQIDIARRVQTSGAQISRIEHGKAPRVALRQLARVAAVVGLKMSVRTFPAGRRLIDGGQLALFEKLRGRSAAVWDWTTEVSMPIAGDFRAADAVAAIPGCRIAIELITRLVDFQGQTRAALLKQRDLGADRLLIVVLGSNANRRALRDAEPAIRESFPVGTRDALAALAAGRDPGGNAIVLL